MGSGDNILVWEEPWIPDLPLFRPVPREVTLDQQSITVAQLMNHDKSAWDEHVLKSLFDDPTITAIHNIPRWFCELEDRWVWLQSSTGEFSIKAAYRIAREEGTTNQSNPVLNKLWKLPLHARQKMFLWRVVLNILPTRAALTRFVSDMDTSCPICGHHLETLLHLL